jgi:hypothetical protein
MKRSKVFVGLCVIGLVLFGMIGGASAAIVSPVQIYAVDTDGDGSVGLSNINFQLANSQILQMCYDGTCYQLDDTVSHVTVNNFDANNLQLVGFQIVNTSGAVIRDSATLEFIGAPIVYNGIDVYSGVAINWEQGTSATLTIADIGSGGVAAAPIPASVLLLGSGVIGLIAFRRRIGGDS